MYLGSTRMIRRSNSMSPKIPQNKTDDFMVFVLRSKASAFESATSYEDIFCVVRDSYGDRINKGNTFATTQTQRKPSTAERISSTNGCNLSLQPNSVWNTSEQIKDNNHGSESKAILNLKLFRDYLTFFEVHPSSSISYMDDKHKLCSVQTETEFLELWKFAKSSAKHNKGVLLLIDLTNNPDMINSNDKISTVNDQKSLRGYVANIPDNFQLRESTVEVNDNNVQNSDDYDTFTPVSNLTTSCSRIVTKENGNVKLEGTVPSNTNSQDFFNEAPPIWFVQYMEQFKQDIIKEVSDQIMVNAKKNLNECPMKSSGHARLEDAVQSENQVYNHRSRSNRQKNNLLIDQRRLYKSIVKTKKKKEKKLEEKLEYNSEDDKNKEKANNHDKKHNSSKFIDDVNREDGNSKEKANYYDRKYNVSNFMDNMNSIFRTNNTTFENETVNNHDSMPPDFLESQRSSKENLNEPNIASAIDGSEFRMNCSITEHQMLDKTNFTSRTCHCGCDTENISLSSDISTGEDVSVECNFEMIPKPSSEETKHFLKIKGKKSKDYSGFCLLPDMYPTQPSTICIDEDHFAANLNSIPNDKESSVHDDVNTTIHNACPFDKCQESDISEFTNNICKKLIENSSAPARNEINTEPECSNANNLKTDVNDSHTSYMTTKPTNTIYSDSPETQHIYQPPTNLKDLTLSFHSHTTSIADDGHYFKRETNTATSHDYSKNSLSNSSRPANSTENNTCEQLKKNITYKNPYKKLSREKNNGKSDKHVKEDTAAKPVEPVHILPETLVTGALHLASFAYGTAREAIVKIRTNSKDVRSSHARMNRH